MTIKIKDLLNKKLNQIKIESDKNDKLIADSFELLSQIKSNCQQLESMANQINSWFFSPTIRIRS